MRIASLLVALILFIVATPGRAGADDVVAVVDGVDITVGDIDLRMRNDPDLRFQPIDSAPARLEALRQLTVEITADHAMHATLATGNDLAMAVEHNRRQTTLGVYETMSTRDISLAPDEVDKFIDANPQFFSQRKTWHYHEVAVKSEDPQAVPAMRARATAIGQLPSIETAAIGEHFDWARDRNFSTVVINRWQGSEQIAPALLAVLQQMQASQHRVRADCNANTCSFIVLHEVLDDPVDTRFGRDAVEQTLLARKRALAASALHLTMLKRAVIEFRDPALARLAGEAWMLPPYLKAGGLTKAIWTVQLSLLLLTLIWAPWYIRRGRERPLGSAFPQKRQAKNGDGPDRRPFYQVMQTCAVLVTIALVTTEVAWALATTSFIAFSHDFAVVAGGCFIILIGSLVLWRHSPPARVLAGRLRFTSTALLGGCALAGSITWLVR